MNSLILLQSNNLKKEKINGLKNWIGGSILQVNEIDLTSLTFNEALQIFKDVKNQKFQSVRLIISKNVSGPINFRKRSFLWQPI